MLSLFQERAQRVEELMRNSGLNSLDYVEQFSYLLFLKFLSDILPQPGNLSKGEQLQNYWRYSTWNSRDASDLPRFVSQELFPRLASRGIGHPNIDTGVQAIFNNAYLLVREPTVLKQIIEIIGDISFGESEPNPYSENFTIQEAYDTLIGNLAADNMQLFGPFYTPKFLVRLIVDLARPQLNEAMYDPAFGTGGILAAAGDYIKERSKKTNFYFYGNDIYSIKNASVYGREVNFRIFKLGIMRLVFHGINPEGLQKGDSLSREAQTSPQPSYQVILTNMLFEGGTTSTASRADFPIHTHDFSALFLQHVTTRLAPNGRAVIVVPEGLLFRGDTEQEVRRYVLESFELESVLSLPHGVFAPYTSGKASILVIRNTGRPTASTWFYEISNQEIERLRNPMRDSSVHFDLDNFRSDKNSRKVLIDEIVKENFTLNASRYISQTEGLVYSQVSLDTVLCLSEDKAPIIIESNQQLLQLSVNTHHQGVDFLSFISSNDLRNTASKKQYQQVHAGQILIDPTNFSQGALGVVPLQYDKGVVPQRYYVYSLINPSINPDFLDFCLRSRRLLDELAALARASSGRLRLASKAILSIILPVPSLETQNEYVGRLHTQREASLHAFRLLKTLNELGDGIDPATFGSYQRVRLKDVIESMQGGLQNSGTRDGGELTLIRVRNIQRSGINLADSVFVDRNTLRDADERLLKKDDILFVRVHGSREEVGRCVVFDLPGDYVCSSNIVRVRLNFEKANPHFVVLYLNSPLGRREVTSRSRASVQYSINQDDILSLLLTLPDLNEQKAILKRVRDQQKRRRQLTDALQELRDESFHVIEEILAELYR
ncbi:N-6 DNA methylase [Candidatus Chloroploca mongolica]|nr:N-6 DNA methylase [Candidatus Chloroploca mongolica]